MAGALAFFGARDFDPRNRRADVIIQPARFGQQARQRHDCRPRLLESLLAVAAPHQHPQPRPHLPRLEDVIQQAHRQPLHPLDACRARAQLPPGDVHQVLIDPAEIGACRVRAAGLTRQRQHEVERHANAVGDDLVGERKNFVRHAAIITLLRRAPAGEFAA